MFAPLGLSLTVLLQILGHHADRGLLLPREEGARICQSCAGLGPADPCFVLVPQGGAAPVSFLMLHEF